MKRILSLLFIMIVWSGVLLAQDREASLQPGVARMSLIHGEVSTQRGDSGDQVAASLNTPIVAGDQIAAGPNSRAEVQLDYANLVRLDQNAVTKIAELSSGNIHLQVGQGQVNYNVLKGSESQAEIDTPNLVVRPLEEGSYRILVNSPNQTQVIVRKGSAEIVTPQGSTRVEKGQIITVEGTDNPQYQTASAPKKDAWDDWNKDRDNLISNAESRRRTGQYYTGSQDLDAYGHWQDDPDYGSVWVPAVTAGWAPYRSGRWSWAPYYGWTWVSYEPWGWAPYHYGRWVYRNNFWCWWPGPVAVYPAYRPVWAPAYVSFFGFGGGGFHFGVSFGDIGWAPCGPVDPYYPWYGSGVNRINYINVQNIKNVTNVTNVNNIYNYQGRVVPPLHARARGLRDSNIYNVINDPRMRHGITTMSANDFGKSSVPRHQPTLDSGTVRRGQMLAGGVPVVPTRESLKPANKLAPNTVAAKPADYRRYLSEKNKLLASANEPKEVRPQFRSFEPKATINLPKNTKFNIPIRTNPSIAPTKTLNPIQRQKFQSFSRNDSKPQTFKSFTRNESSVQKVPSSRPIIMAQKPQNFQSFSQHQTRKQPSTLPQQRESRPQVFNWSQNTAPRNETFRPSPQRVESRPQNFSAPQGMESKQPRITAPQNNSRSYQRPPLNLRQPIVTPRSPSSLGGRQMNRTSPGGNFNRR